MAAQTGVADQFPIKIFETDVGAVSAGTPQGGWVSGSPASLALSASAVCLFDLGQDWHQFPTVCICINSAAPSSGLNPVTVFSSDTITQNTARRLKDINATGPSSVAANVTTAGGAQEVNVRPKGRYLHVSVTNADAVNAQGAGGKITIAAYPD